LYDVYHVYDVRRVAKRRCSAVTPWTGRPLSAASRGGACASPRSWPCLAARASAPALPSAAGSGVHRCSPFGAWPFPRRRLRLMHSPADARVRPLTSRDGRDSRGGSAPPSS